MKSAATGPERDMRRRVKGIAVSIGLSVLAVTCGVAGTPRNDGPPSTNTYEGAWVLVHGRSHGGEVPLVDGYRITLTLADDEVGGTAACNSYGGRVAIVGDSFSLKDGLSMTEMACAPHVMGSESAYIAALSAVDMITLDGNTLTLTGPDTELRFERLAPPPIRELTDTTWHLESMLEGTGPDGTASSAAPAELLLTSDGKLSGSTGCREFEGEWIERGDEILFTRLSAEGLCSRDLQGQDDHVLGVLGDGFTARIEANTLTVYGSAELGLLYSAGSTG
jgi:heat shock protein HslJ